MFVWWQRFSYRRLPTTRVSAFLRIPAKHRDTLFDETTAYSG